MVAQNSLLKAPPFPVAQAVQALGANLRTARLRRNLSLQDMAEKIGVERHAVAAAEKGKPSTSIAIYAALLWALGLEGQLQDVAGPDRDQEGKTLAQRRERARAAPARGAAGQGLSDDF